MAYLERRGEPTTTATRQNPAIPTHARKKKREKQSRKQTRFLPPLTNEANSRAAFFVQGESFQEKKIKKCFIAVQKYMREMSGIALQI